MGKVRKDIYTKKRAGLNHVDTFDTAHLDDNDFATMETTVETQKFESNPSAVKGGKSTTKSTCALKKKVNNLSASRDKKSRSFSLSPIESGAVKKKKIRKLIFKIAFLLLNIVLVVIVLWNFAHEQGGIQPLSTLLSNNPKWTMLIIALLLYVVTVLFNTLKFAIFIFSKTKKFRFFFSLKMATIGRYYDFITPLGTGGQPFEIYYMKKNGYSGETSTAIPLAKYMVWQVSFMLLCLVILIAYSKNYLSAPIVLVCAWIGLSITLLLFLFVFFMSVTKKMGVNIVVGVLKLLNKMKIIKNYRKTLVKVLRFVHSYQKTMKNFVKQPITLLLEIIVTMGSLISNALIAYFILLAFVDVPSVSWWDIVCKCTICDLAVSFFPMPGGSGAQEFSFGTLLGTLFPSGTLFWGILIWRILTYYLYIFQGVLFIVGDSIASRVKSKKQKTISTVKD